MRTIKLRDVTALFIIFLLPQQLLQKKVFYYRIYDELVDHGRIISLVGTLQAQNVDFLLLSEN